MVFPIRRLCRGQEAVTKPLPFFKRNTIELPKGYRQPRKRKQKAVAEPAQRLITVKQKPRIRYRRNGRMMPFRRRNEPIPRGINWCQINGQKLRQDVFFGDVIGRKWIPGQLTFFDNSALPMGDGCVVTNRYGDGGCAGDGAGDGACTGDGGACEGEGSCSCGGDACGGCEGGDACACAPATPRATPAPVTVVSARVAPVLAAARAVAKAAVPARAAAVLVRAVSVVLARAARVPVMLALAAPVRPSARAVAPVAVMPVAVVLAGMLVVALALATSVVRHLATRLEAI